MDISPKKTYRCLTSIWKDVQHITKYYRNANKTTMRYHLTPGRMAIIKKSTNNKSQREYGEKGTLPHY